MGWSLAVTAPNSEFRAARALTRYSFEHHLFKIRRRIICRGRVVDCIRPAFPRYIFADVAGFWSELRERCSAIVSFVRDSNGGIAILPDPVVTSLIAACDANGIMPTPEITSPRFHLGDRVLIRGNGVMTGQRAIFQHLLNENSALVEIDWLGRMCPIAIAECDLILELEIPKPVRRKRRRRRWHKDRGGSAVGPTRH